MKGAREAHRVVLADRPGAAGGAVFVFSPVMPGDSRDAAALRAEELADPRAVFLWDPDRRVGRALAGSLGMGRGGFAWDVYCLYPPAAAWGGTLPAPARWVHQLQGAAPDHAAYGHVGQALAEGLEALLRGPGAAPRSRPGGASPGGPGGAPAR